MNFVIKGSYKTPATIEYLKDRITITVDKEFAKDYITEEYQNVGTGKLLRLMSDRVARTSKDHLAIHLNCYKDVKLQMLTVQHTDVGTKIGLCCDTQRETVLQACIDSMTLLEVWNCFTNSGKIMVRYELDTVRAAYAELVEDDEDLQVIYFFELPKEFTEIQLKEALANHFKFIDNPYGAS